MLNDIKILKPMYRITATAPFQAANSHGYIYHQQKNIKSGCSDDVNIFKAILLVKVWIHNAFTSTDGHSHIQLHFCQSYNQFEAISIASCLSYTVGYSPRCRHEYKRQE